MFIQQIVIIDAYTLRMGSSSQHAPIHQSTIMEPHHQYSNNSSKDDGTSIVTGNDELQFLRHLVDDADKVPHVRGVKRPDRMSYIDFLCWAHKKISFQLTR
uniref:Cone cGMP-specific 3',5'-cyclic phosphodiesterase subunit alpha n=1 Tax=Lygus hesperus TaxID=30085 RepID=A0A0A9YU91_LYGHE